MLTRFGMLLWVEYPGISSRSLYCMEVRHFFGVCTMAFNKPSARMRSEGYGSRPVCVCVCVCVWVCVCPGRSSATHATKRQTRHTHGLSILVAPESIWGFSYNGFVSKIAIAFPYLRPHGSRPFLYAKRAHFPHSFSRTFGTIETQELLEG